MASYSPRKSTNIRISAGSLTPLKQFFQRGHWLRCSSELLLWWRKNRRQKAIPVSLKGTLHGFFFTFSFFINQLNRGAHSRFAYDFVSAEIIDTNRGNWFQKPLSQSVSVPTVVKLVMTCDRVVVLITVWNFSTPSLFRLWKSLFSKVFRKTALKLLSSRHHLKNLVGESECYHK
jgi:hypothetical protein